MNFISANWILVVIVAAFIILNLYFRQKEINKDKNMDYSIEGVTFIIRELATGEKIALFEYGKSTEKNKINYILDNYYQGVELEDKDGNKYVIDELNDKNFHLQEQNSINGKTKNSGPYIAFTIKSL